MLTPSDLLKRADLYAAALEAHPYAADVDLDEAAYLRDPQGYACDIQPGRAIGPQAAVAYLRCTVARIDYLDRTGR